MSARKKLNAAVVCGSIFTAAIIGLALQSSVVFLLSLAVLVATASRTCSGALSQGATVTASAEGYFSITHEWRSLG